MFEPPNKDLPVKAVLISGPSCAGKTHLLKCISDENKFSQITIFEMDSLEYYHPKKLEAQLGHAKIRFDSWFLAQKKSQPLNALYNNIKNSKDDARLIKYTLIELCIMPEKFITIFPQTLRKNHSGRKFIELIEKIFSLRIAHVAVIPSNCRYILNFTYRLKILNIPYIKRMWKGRNSLYLQKNNFDYAHEPCLFSNKEQVTINAFHQLLKT